MFAGFARRLSKSVGLTLEKTGQQTRSTFSGGRVEPQKPLRKKIDVEYGDLPWQDGIDRTFWEFEPYRYGSQRDAVKIGLGVLAAIFGVACVGREVNKMKRPMYAPSFHANAYEHPEEYSRRPWNFHRFANHDSDIVFSKEEDNPASFSNTFGQRAQVRAQNAAGTKTLNPSAGQ